MTRITHWLQSTTAPRYQAAFRLGCAAVAVGLCGAGTVTGPLAGYHPRLGAEVPFVAVIPFVMLLLSIAIMPIVAGHWWERNRNKAIVAGVLAVGVAAYLIGRFGSAGYEAIADAIIEYFAFIALLAALFVISGNIAVRGSLAGTPGVNAAMLAGGALLANVVGTTGASMLLIRPLIRANEGRRQMTHVFVFFIFIVSNCGGLLTPFGDPPLFLGHLAGVPFEWTLRLWKQWAFLIGALVAIFYVLDILILKRELRAGGALLRELVEHAPLRIDGGRNLLFLGGVLLTVFAAARGWGNGGHHWPHGIQEVALVALTVASFATTAREVRRLNQFTFGPIIEVAVLFAGIFVTMAPALVLLNAHGPALGVDRPWEYFWATGALSGVLDNAPTYLALASAAAGAEHIPAHGTFLAEFLALPPERGAHATLAAIACGAVWMGALTYIGNGPNLMVKAIVDERKVPMPGFFGYIAWSASVLLPLFVIATFIFFRG